MRTPSLPSVVTRTPTRSSTVVVGEPGLRLEQLLLVVVGDQVRRAVDERADVLAGHPGQLLRRVGHERVPALAALLRCAGPSPAGSFGLMITRSRPPRRSADRASSMLRASLIAPGVERGDLAHVLVGGADEAGGVRDLADVHRLAVDAVALQPAAGSQVEVGADRADQGRAQARAAPSRTRCWPRCRRGGPPGRRPGTTATPCAAGRRGAARRTGPGSASGGRWRSSR